jgi:anti-sigma factor RsiW
MKMDDSLLIAYVDGLLSPDERDKIEREIEQSPEAAACVEQLYASRVRYAHAFAHQKLPALPPSLADKVGEITRAHQARAATAANRGTPAPAPTTDTLPHAPVGANDAFSPREAGTPPLVPIRSRLRFAPTWLAVAFVAGAFFCGAVLRFAPGVAPSSASDPSMMTAATNGDASSPWVQAAVGYQQLYTRDTEAFTHSDAQVASRTVSAIRHDDGVALRVPDLSAAGLTFRRVQRLQFHGRPLVQIVYLPEKGPPIALCVVKDRKPDSAVAPHDINGMTVVTWRQGELSYALIGKPEGVDLVALGHQIAERITDQLFGNAQLPFEVERQLTHERSHERAFASIGQGAAGATDTISGDRPVSDG